MDFLSLLENDAIKNSPYFTGTGVGFNTQLAWRKATFRALRAKEITFSEFFKNLLPGRFKSDLTMDKVHEYADRELEQTFKELGIGKEETNLTLFGKPFYPYDNSLQSWIMAFRNIVEIVAHDQYQVPLIRMKMHLSLKVRVGWDSPDDLTGCRGDNPPRST